MKEYHRAIVEASSEEEKKKAEYRMYKVITDRLEKVWLSIILEV